MRFRITQRFDAPLDDVETALLDPAFLERLGQLPKLGKPQLLDVEVTGETVRRRIRYAFAGQLSSAVTAVVDPAKLTWVEDSTTDRRTHRTTFRILPDHYADRLNAGGTFTLDAIGTRTQRVAEGDLRVRFPLVGGRVEKAIVSGMEEYAAAEADAIANWLAQRG
ncbi:MAG: hypothetical protein QOG87_2865 [Actinomycetota bacterium]|jgi:hypothetical protein